MAKKILIVGAKGKMGDSVCKRLKSVHEIIEVQRCDFWGDFEADLIVDFASAESSVLSAEFASKNGIPLIVGSTGQSEAQLKQIDEFCKGVPYLVCANFSIGVFLLKTAIDGILKQKIDEIAIFEKHHNAKKDSPSGTALSLQRFIEEKQSAKVQMLSLRGGKEVGTHKVSFYFGSELIEISHTAFSREAFAEGVALAVQFMLEQKNAKRFEFEDILRKKLGFN